jgi:hypothetical protein
VSQDVIYYRPVSKKIIVSTSIDLDVKVETEVDFSKPVRSLLPYFCRRFGMRLPECLGLKIEDGTGAFVNAGL